MYNISGKFSNYLQIPGHLLHFIPTIIDIIIFRQVDNKRFNLIIKYMVHNMKKKNLFNGSFYWIYFFYMLSALSPQLLMAYFHRHSSDARVVSMEFNMQQYGDNLEQNSQLFQPYCFPIFLLKIFSNNTNFVGIGYRISISYFDIKAIISSFFMFMVDAFSINLVWYFAFSITATIFFPLRKFVVNVFSS